MAAPARRARWRAARAAAPRRWRTRPGPPRPCACCAPWRPPAARGRQRARRTSGLKPVVRTGGRQAAQGATSAAGTHGALKEHRGHRTAWPSRRCAASRRAAGPSGACPGETLLGETRGAGLAGRLAPTSPDQALPVWSSVSLSTHGSARERAGRRAFLAACRCVSSRSSSAVGGSGGASSQRLLTTICSGTTQRRHTYQ